LLPERTMRMVMNYWIKRGKVHFIMDTCISM
jgi:hypothetical protein